MWTQFFFLYIIVVAILSAIVATELSAINAQSIKYLNEIVLTMSVALTTFIVGILVGQSSCTSKREFDNVPLIRVSFLLFAAIIESFLIAMISKPEFQALVSTNAQSIIIGMLVLNTLGIIGGGIIVFSELKEGPKHDHIANKFAFQAAK